MTSRQEALPSHPELWLCRHGETEWSRDGRHTSRTDLPLTSTGEDQARALAPRLHDAAFDLVLTSPRRRSRDTAVLAGFPDAVDEPDAVEWDYGDYEGLTTAAIRRTVPGWTVWTQPVPRGETADVVAARADRLIARVRQTVTRRALLFSHGHFARVVAVRWLGLAPSQGRHLSLDTGTVSVLGRERETPTIVRWNA